MAEPGIKPMSDSMAHYLFAMTPCPLKFLHLSVACSINHLLQPLIISLGFHVLGDYSKIHLGRVWEPQFLFYF